jgi:hypothetical protein
MMNQTANSFSPTKPHEGSRRKEKRSLPFFVSSSCHFVDKFFRQLYKLGLTFLFVLGLSFLAQAQAQTFGEITVTVESFHTSIVGEGYCEFRATITNDSKTQAHKVALVLRSYGYGSNSVGVGELKRTAELAPLSTANVIFFSPVYSSSSDSGDVWIDGTKQKENFEVKDGKVGFSLTQSDKGSLLLSQQVYKADLLNKGNFEKSLKDAAGQWQVATQSYEFPVSEWSQNWLSFARFGGVVLQADELDAAPEGVRLALLRYVERGGTLIVAGNWQPPAQWQARRGGIKDEEVQEDESSENNSALVASTPGPAQAASSSSTPKSKPQADLPVYYIGFGVVVVTGTVGQGEVAVNQWKRLSKEWGNAALADNDFSSLGAVNQEFQVVENFGVPIRGLFLLMLLFVIVIGPVNLLWLAKKKRKIWMLWTVPAISLLTCLLVAGFSLFGEGWNATAKTEALTILDETAHRATTIGWTGFYSPITPSEGLHFSYETEIAPQVPQYWDYRSRMPERTVDWTSDQHLDSGWIAARIPAFFKVRKSETRRERLNIRQAGNEARLVNGLGADIAQIWWADANGKIHSAENIAAGAQASLRATELKASGTPTRLREAYKGDWLKEFSAFTDKPQDVLMPNSYLAVLNGAPFVEEGLKDVKMRSARNLVYGVSDQNPAR